jgi:hypothetical protein
MLSTFNLEESHFESFEHIQNYMLRGTVSFRKMICSVAETFTYVQKTYPQNHAVTFANFRTSSSCLLPLVNPSIKIRTNCYTSLRKSNSDFRAHCPEIRKAVKGSSSRVFATKAGICVCQLPLCSGPHSLSAVHSSLAVRS